MLIIRALLIIPIILAQYLHLCSISDNTYVLGKGHMYVIHSISKSFPNIAFETVPTFVWPWPTLILSMKMSGRTFHLYTADRNMVEKVLHDTFGTKSKHNLQTWNHKYLLINCYDITLAYIFHSPFIFQKHSAQEPALSVSGNK